MGWIVFAVGTLHACASDTSDPEPDVDQGVLPIVGLSSGAVCAPQGSTLTYANFGRQFMSMYCIRCHTQSITGGMRLAPPDRNFDDVALIRPLANVIDQQSGAGPTKVNTTMPPDPPMPSPTLTQRQRLSEWLACGAKMGAALTGSPGAGPAQP